MTWVLPHMFIMYFDHINLSSSSQSCWFLPPFQLTPHSTFMSIFGGGATQWVSIELLAEAWVKGFCMWSLLPSETLLMCMACAATWGHGLCFHQGPFWGLWSCFTLGPCEYPWLCYHQRSRGCPWSVLPPEAELSSADSIAVRGYVDTWDCIAAEGHDGVCGLCCGQGHVDVCGLYSHQKPCGSSWSVLLLTIKGKEAPFVVVLMTADLTVNNESCRRLLWWIVPLRVPPKRINLDRN